MDDCHTISLKSADGTALLARHWSVGAPRATLVIVHGFGEHSGRYAHLAQHMVGHGVQVVAGDLRGHGRSAGKRGVVGDYAEFHDDLHALLDRARGWHEGVPGPLVLYGHSMGGGVVLDHGLSRAPSMDGRFVGEEIVDGVIVSAPLIALPQPIAKPLELAVRAGAKLMPKAALKQPMAGDKISTIPEERLEYERDALNHDRGGLRLLVGMIDTGASIAARAADWPQDLPLLILHSQDDELTSFSASRDFAQTAAADFRALQGVAHEIHNDTSRPVVYRAILDFIDRPDVGRAARPHPHASFKPEGTHP